MTARVKWYRDPVSRLIDRLAVPCVASVLIVAHLMSYGIVAGSRGSAYRRGTNQLSLGMINPPPGKVFQSRLTMASLVSCDTNLAERSPITGQR